MSGIEELKDSRKKRARKDSDSSSPSPIKKRKSNNTFQIRSPPRHKLVHTQLSSSSIHSEIDYNDEIKDPDYSILGKYYLFIFVPNFTLLIGYT